MLRGVDDDEIEMRTIQQLRQYIVCASRATVLNDALLAASRWNVDRRAGLLRDQLQHIGQSRVFRINRELAVSINDHGRMFGDAPVPPCAALPSTGNGDKIAPAAVLASSYRGLS